MNLETKKIWGQLFIAHKDANIIFEGWNLLDLLDIIPVQYDMQN